MATCCIGSDVCPVLEVEKERCEMRIESLVNGGCNYNNHKVAKFIGSSFLSCMKDVTIAPLSPAWTQ
jgi:hypothetical protein